MLEDVLKALNDAGVIEQSHDYSRNNKPCGNTCTCSCESFATANERRKLNFGTFQLLK